MTEMPKLSNEGIPRRDYRIGQLLIALAPGVSLWAFLSLIRLTIKEPEAPALALPRKSLIIGLHRELGFFMSSRSLWKTLKNQPFAWIGIHHWSSYFGSLELWLRHTRCFRYTTRADKKPFHQILEFLREFPDPVFIRTDAGGPYDRVKISAIRMAIQSERDIVGFRQWGDSTYTVTKGHVFPHPFSTVYTGWTSPISWRELAGLSEEQALARVQAEMEKVAPIDRRATAS